MILHVTKNYSGNKETSYWDSRISLMCQSKRNLFYLFVEFVNVQKTYLPVIWGSWQSLHLTWSFIGSGSRSVSESRGKSETFWQEGRKYPVNHEKVFIDLNRCTLYQCLWTSTPSSLFSSLLYCLNKFLWSSPRFVSYN